MTIDTTALVRSMPWDPDDRRDWETNEHGELDAFFSYTDRASYLAWVSVWKEEYAALSDAIPVLKRSRRELQRDGAFDSHATRPLRASQVAARALLALRRAAKRDSWARRARANVA